MIIVRPRYIVNEYSWEAKDPQGPSNLTETILTVSFDHGAQRLFSSVRINVTHNKNVSTETVVGEWKFTPGPSLPPTIDEVSRVSSAPLETECVRPNPPSLPILDINFEIESTAFVSLPNVRELKLNSRKLGVPSPRGALTFKSTRDQPHQTLLEIKQPLTTDTQSVSASFRCSSLLYTPGLHGSGVPLDDSSTVGRVVHIRPIALPHNHNIIPLPTEVLLMIFRNFAQSSTVCSGWRRDLLSCALVCKQWTCALDPNLLLSDFHYYPQALAQQNGYPPEISSFAIALASYPSLALSITHLSPDYFLKHTRWKFISSNLVAWPLHPKPGTPYAVITPFEQFLASFLSILRLARNLRSLSCSSPWGFGLPRDFLDALRGLDKVEEVDVNGNFNTIHQAYLTVWPSLKRLKMWIQPTLEGTELVVTTPPRCALTDVTLSFTRNGDEYLNYVLSSSSTSLKRLVLQAPLEMTNAGLHTALRGVSTSLVTLEIGSGGTGPSKDEEHALDSLIVQMERLEYLVITPMIATHLMIERRSEAFKQNLLPIIIIIKLTIHLSTTPNSSRGNGLLVAASQVWPGWTINTRNRTNGWRLLPR